MAQDPYRHLAMHVQGVERLPVVAERFGNGELHLTIPGGERLAGRWCYVLGTAAPPDRNAAVLTMATHAARRCGADGVTALMPYLGYARQDRAPAGMSLGAQWLGQLLAGAGVDDAVTVDIHSDDARGLLGMPVRSLDPAPTLAAALPEPWRSASCVVAPDGGARERCRRFAHALGGAQTVWLEKRRTAAGVEHVAVHGDLGPRVVLVDDIIDSGATLLSACRLLQGCGVQDLAIVATHGVLSGTAWHALWAHGVRLIMVSDTLLSHVPHRRDLRVVSVGRCSMPLSGSARQPIAQHPSSSARWWGAATDVRPRRPLRAAHTVSDRGFPQGIRSLAPMARGAPRRRMRSSTTRRKAMSDGRAMSRITSEIPPEPGDELEVKGRPGAPARKGLIVAVLGEGVHQHYRVRWDEQHESLFFPEQGEGVHVIHPRRHVAPQAKSSRHDKSTADTWNQ